MHQSFEIFDRTTGRTVNEVEAYDLDSELYGNVDAVEWYGDLVEATVIMDTLTRKTGHEFVIRRR